MGCVSSQHHPRCHNCKSPCEPLPKRSFSMNLRRAFSRKRESYHMVPLSSSSYSSLKLDPNSCERKRVVDEHHHCEIHDQHVCCIDRNKDYATRVNEAKKWSEMIDKKIPRANGSHSSSTPETPGPISKRDVDFNHEVTCAFRKALGDLPPSNPFYLKPLDDNQQVVEEQNGNGITSIEVTEEKKINGDVVEEKRVNVVVNKLADKMSSNNEQKIDTRIKIPSGYLEKDTIRNERVIFFFTSLRGVRKTYEDCCYVRVILKGLGVRVDEKDVSMHSGYKDELKELLGHTVKGGLPKVFVGEKYIGGIEEIQKMHEDGLLGRAFEECERLEDDSGNLTGVCEGCDDVRFVPCETCSGSCKIFREREDDNKEDEEDNGFQRCPDCNENGLVRCPMCCSSS